MKTLPRHGVIPASFTAAIDADVQLLGHATSPLLSARVVYEGLDGVETGPFDSAMTVKRQHESFWRDGERGNYDPQNISRTQELEPIFVETSGFFIFMQRIFARRSRRAGTAPLLVEVSKIATIDGDEPVHLDMTSVLNPQAVTIKTPQHIPAVRSSSNFGVAQSPGSGLFGVPFRPRQKDDESLATMPLAMQRLAFCEEW
jgi:CMP-N-acetylneuraminic acid synthetase